MTSNRPSLPAISADLRLTDEQFTSMRDLLAAFGGMYLDTAQQRMLESGLAQRLAVTGETLERYERRIQTPDGRHELHKLIELVLNHETFFFRNGPHLRALRNVLLHEIQRRKPVGQSIRIWSAGCSTGEEAYSLAITAIETLGRRAIHTVEIYATDLSEPALQTARAGIYRGRALNNVTPDLLERYFQPRNDSYTVGPELREMVRFSTLNLLEPFPEHLRGVDAIFCQNVTIYFQPATRRDLIARFYDCLPPDGMLFLGFSETLWNLFDGFRSREVAGAYVYHKAAQPASTAPKPAPTRRAPEPAHERHATPNQRPAPRPARPPASQPARPDPPEQAILQTARDQLNQGHVAAALDALRTIDPQSPLAPETLMLVARAHADRGDLDLAIAEVRRALEIDTLHEEAYLLLGVIYLRQGNAQAAVQQLERARYLNPNAPLISFHLAAAYQQSSRTDLAAREFRNTMWKLESYAPDILLDGVAVGWLRETCQRQLVSLS